MKEQYSKAISAHEITGEEITLPSRKAFKNGDVFVMAGMISIDILLAQVKHFYETRDCLFCGQHHLLERFAILVI